MFKVGVPVAKRLNNDIFVSEFELQLRYYAHFRTNIRREGANPLNPHICVKYYPIYKNGICIN